MRTQAESKETRPCVEGLSIVIPAYNEEEGVGEVIDQILAAMVQVDLPHEIIVVDDGSQDRTAEIVAGKPVRLLRHGTNRGYGAALKTGIAASAYRHVAIVDGDGTYEPADLVKLVQSMADSDMVVGARTGKGARIPLLRRPAKWFLTRLANYLTETKIPDLNSGFRIFDKEVAERFFPILPSNFSFTTTLTMAMLTSGYSVAFLPTRYGKRKGKSKIRPVRDTINFLSLVLRTALYFAPLKIFLRLSVFLMALSLFKMIVIDILLIQNMTDSTLLLLLAGIQVGMLGLLADLIDKRSPPMGGKR